MQYHVIYLHHTKFDGGGNSETVGKTDNPDAIDVWVALESEEHGITDSVEEFSFPIGQDYQGAYDAAQNQLAALSIKYNYAKTEEY